MRAVNDKTQVHVLEFRVCHCVPGVPNTELQELMSALLNFSLALILSLFSPCPSSCVLKWEHSLCAIVHSKYVAFFLFSRSSHWRLNLESQKRLRTWIFKPFWNC